MRNLTILLALVFTVTFSSPSFAEWKKLGLNEFGHTIYVDFGSIRKQDGYVFWWQLVDLSKPDNEGHLSYTDFFQGDCNLFRFKTLSENHYKKPMGRGSDRTINPDKPTWKYSPPNSMIETALKSVCSR